MPVELLVTKELYENRGQSFASLCVEALLSCSEEFVVLHVVRAFVPDLIHRGYCKGSAVSAGLPAVS